MRRWLWLLRFVAVGFGAAGVWAAISRHSMNPDGVSYMDMGDATLAGDWSVALNSVWSPLYAWILGIVGYLVQPTMRWEFPLVHGVNFAIYLLSLAGFEFLWRQLRSDSSDSAFSDRFWWAIGYGLFLWASLTLIKIWSVTPDLLMSFFVYVAAGSVVRLRRGVTTWSSFVVLGCALGVGYLAKAPMLPIGVAFIAAAALVLLREPRMLLRLVVTVLLFVAIPAPWIAAVSLSKGRLALGDSGSLTYVKHVNLVRYPHWQGLPAGDGSPLHPTRQIHQDPPLFEFAGPIGGTYPVSYDPGYWYEGVVARVDWKLQRAALSNNLGFLFRLFARQQAALFVCLLVLACLAHWTRRSPLEQAGRWALLLPAAAGLGLYVPILVADRYIGVFVVLLWADLLRGLSLRRSEKTARLAGVCSWIFTGVLLMHLLGFHLAGATRLSTTSPEPTRVEAIAPTPSWPGAVALALHQGGISAGDPVGVIGYGFDSFWARLAHVRIVAELMGDDAGPFWEASRGERASVLQAFAQTEARAIVAEEVPDQVTMTGWTRVERSNVWIYFLPRD